MLRLLFYFILFTFKQYHVYKWECCNKIVVKLYVKHYILISIDKSNSSLLKLYLRKS